MELRPPHGAQPSRGSQRPAGPQPAAGHDPAGQALDMHRPEDDSKYRSCTGAEPAAAAAAWGAAHLQAQCPGTPPVKAGFETKSRLYTLLKNPPWFYLVLCAPHGALRFTATALAIRAPRRLLRLCMLLCWTKQCRKGLSAPLPAHAGLDGVRCGRCNTLARHCMREVLKF